MSEIQADAETRQAEAAAAHLAKAPARHARPGSTDHGKRVDIQVLRAISVLLVIAAHFGYQRLAGGYIGVDVFFVISGFVITDLLLRENERTGNTSILRFYARRARRIVPLSTVVLLATILAAYHWLGFLRGATVVDDARWAAGFLANIHFAEIGTSYLGAQAAPSPIQHYWSLGVEEQFYVVWPLLFLLCTRWRRLSSGRAPLIGVLICVLVGSFVWSVIQTHSDGSWAYFSPLTRSCELAAGALLAVLVPTIRGFALPVREILASVLTVGGLVLIAVGALVFKDDSAFPGALIAVPVLGAVAVLIGGTLAEDGGILALPALRQSLARIGDISFSLYLWHWPILIIAEQNSSSPLTVADRWELLAAAFVMSVASYVLIERPFRQAEVLVARPVVSLLVGAVLVASIFVVSALEIHSHPAIYHSNDSGDVIG